MITLEDKLLLRKPELSDLDSLYILKNDIESNSSLVGFSTGYSRTAINDWINFHNNATNEVIFIMQAIDSAKIIGHVGLYNIDNRIRKASFAILIADKDYRGRGYGDLCTKFMLNYGFNQLNLNRIELTLLSNNSAALALYLKNGFIQEGVQKQAQFKNGCYHDIILMAKFNNEKDR